MTAKFASFYSTIKFKRTLTHTAAVYNSGKMYHPHHHEKEHEAKQNANENFSVGLMPYNRDDNPDSYRECDAPQESPRESFGPSDNKDATRITTRSKKI
ncbi:MAG: hypothetical protein QM594_17590 [Niabella sp.]